MGTAPNHEPRWRRCALLLAPVLVLVLVRGLQLRTYGPVFHQGEWLDFAELARVWRDGSDVDLGLVGALRAYTYESFSQGVLLVQLGTALLGLVIENLTVCLFLVAMMFEVAGFSALLALGRRLEGPIWPVAAAWILAPSFVAIWHMLPYGNHSAFWFVPALMAVWLLRSETGRWGPMWLAVLTGAGVLMYRPVLIPALALLIVLLIRRQKQDVQAAAAVVGGVGLAIALAAALFGGVGTDDGTLIARFAPDLEALHPRRAWLVHQFGAPRDSSLGHVVRLLGLLAIPAALGWGWRRRGLEDGAGWVTLFFGIYALGATAAPLISQEAAPEYSLPAWFARLGCLAMLFWTVPSLKHVVGGVLVGFALAGIPDAAGLIQPAAWAGSAGYDGVRFMEVIGTDHVDPDDMPFLLDLAERIEPSPGLGWVLDHPRSGCGWRSWRWPTDPLVDARRGVCGGWSTGDLGEEVVRAQGERGELDLELIGRLAWILGNRDLKQVDEAMLGAPDTVRDAAMAGARAEASESTAAERQ